MTGLAWRTKSFTFGLMRQLNISLALKNGWMRERAATGKVGGAPTKVLKMLPIHSLWAKIMCPSIPCHSLPPSLVRANRGSWSITSNPSTTSTICPDYWSSTINSDNKTVCKVPLPNNKNIGALYDSNEDKTNLENTKGYNQEDNTINFNTDDWNDCDKKDWAIKNNLFWRGVNEFSEC